MENIYLMNFINFLNSKKYRIGFVINGYPVPYNKIIASTRIRVYDVIKMFFKDENFLVEIYNPFRKYDAVIFQKKFDSTAYHLANRPKRNGAKIVLDIDVNYYEINSKYITEKQFKDITKFTLICDAIIVSSDYLKNCVIKNFPELQNKVFLILPQISPIFFSQRKIHEEKDVCNFLYCGYSGKAKQILLIKDILLEIKKKYNIEIVLICEKNPLLEIDDIPVKYIKYNYRNIRKQLLVGDIFIAPRDLNDTYNLGHSFIKIGYPMAMGIPVIASPVPSYVSSPAVLCKTKEEWKESLIKLLESADFRNELGKKGAEYCKDFYSEKNIKKEYIKFLQNLFSNL